VKTIHVFNGKHDIIVRLRTSGTILLPNKNIIFVGSLRQPFLMKNSRAIKSVNNDPIFFKKLNYSKMVFFLSNRDEKQTIIIVYAGGPSHGGRG
jgi:hypothetical protein